MDGACNPRTEHAILGRAERKRPLLTIPLLTIPLLTIPLLTEGSSPIKDVWQTSRRSDATNPEKNARTIPRLGLHVEPEDERAKRAERARSKGQGATIAAMSSQTKQHLGRALEVTDPSVGEPGHRRAVDDAMVGRPTDLHHALTHQIAARIVTRARPCLAESGDCDLRQIDNRTRVRAPHATDVGQAEGAAFEVLGL
eukprot:CAMPEP_0181216148 /NCGR_PEP_ID=MMETSP1096-20121128/26414_1 /TAXON_ID=156174 ORGANISM="Chrysochromulina ericina, Strain CCMP281" /NCGR_SAMPLE_ID=MMETSP1096 /ASSEMBLY_ACC=CAM_ASM_000453 /LENGTH=197 /DNA_ID=CAMNT_0023308095 /DNA_START=761 /DNA_END=1354 /DNA_ORIENTATION=-